mgnify:CR=1 FL=1
MTRAIGALDKAIGEAATEAGKHSTVSAGSNIVVTPTTTAGKTDYQVGLAQDITVNSITADTVTASSKSDPSKKKIFTINVKENNFKTNIKKFVNVSGNWTIDGEVLSDSNQSANDFYMSEDAVVNEKSTIEADNVL